MSTAYPKKSAVAVPGCSLVTRALSATTITSSAITSTKTSPVEKSIIQAPLITVRSATPKVASKPANIQPKVLVINSLKVPNGLSA